MARPTRSLAVAGSWSLVARFVLSGSVGLGGCLYEEKDYGYEAVNGATSSRGGSPATSGSSHNGSKSSGGQVGAGATSDGESGGSDGLDTGGDASGGSGETPADYPEPTVTSLEPPSGAYGTVVTIKGAGLGNPGLAGFKLAVGNLGEVELTPKDKTFVTSWSDEEIVFRFPFPAEGGVSLEGPKGAVVAGEFQPTWHVAQKLETAPAATVLASIVSAPDRLTMLFDTDPLTLLDVGPDGAAPHSVTAPKVDPSSLRLFLNASKKLEAIGVSTDAAPVLVALKNQNDDLVAQATTIKLNAEEYSVAGGTQGAAVWMKRSDGWYRARPGASGWAQDKGPIADTNASSPDRASGSTSDGSLFVAWSVDASGLFDDMERGRMVKLAPTATKFAAATDASGTVDDYVTSLTLRSRGDGLVVTACGSDVDPFGLSGSDHYCFDALHAPGGAHIFGVPVEQKAMAYAFTQARAVVSYCDKDKTWRIRKDDDVEETPGAAIGEAIVYPCAEAVALEIAGSGDFVPVIRYADQTYLLERNPAAP
jgi:hypothetical protein